jgi:adenylate cyclase
MPATTEARFCSACGCGLDAPGREGRAVPAEERRRVSILFADIVGYTAVAERLDHESVKHLTQRFLSRLALEVERFGGYVDQYIGDNVMAVFGAPIAHEDDPERAVRAAWGMQAAMCELNRNAAADYGVELALRVGVNTGEVLAGRIGDEYTVVGDAVNVAARLQGEAPVGGVLVGEETRLGTGDAVEYRRLDPLVVKGRAAPVAAWEVLGVKELADLSPAPAARAPMVGRGAELARLIALSDRVARDGRPLLVRIEGEAGIGKTRLVAELERRLQRRVPPTRFLRGRALGFGSESVYGPLAEMLRAECAIGLDDEAATIDRKLRARLGPLLEEPGSPAHRDERLAPFGQLLGALPQTPPMDLAEEQRRDRRDSFLALVRAVFEALSAEGRLPVLVWEDTQWADEATLELIEHLAAWSRCPLLQIAVARRERSAAGTLSGAGSVNATRLELEPLSRDESIELIEALGEVAGELGRQGPAELAERSGGNPLFAEALFDSLGDRGAGTAEELPDTVRGLLAGRLDALGPFERQLLGHAAVVGPSFPGSALEPLAGGRELADGLAELQRRNLIVAAGGGGGGGEGYAFCHMLVREVAYEMLPKAVRARKHAEVGAALERAGGEQADSSAGALAEHFARAATLATEVRLPADEVARLRASALEHSLRAGDVAAALFANGEALSRYEAALGFADEADPLAFEIAVRRGEVQARLGRVAEAIESWQVSIEHFRELGSLEQVAETHRKVAAALMHAGDRDGAVRQLQRGIKMIRDGPPSEPLARLFGEAATIYMQVGANMLAAYASERALNVARQLGEPRVASRAYGINGRVLGRTGEHARARESLERAVELVRESDPEETVHALLTVGHNCELGEGDYESAERRYREALELAERIESLPGQIELHAAIGRLALHRGEWDLARGAARQVTGLSERAGLLSKRCLADALHGRLHWQAGDWSESERLLVRAEQAATGLGASEVAAEALLSLAATLAETGELAGAEAALSRAGSICEGAALTPLAVEAAAALADLAAAGGRHDQALAAAEHAAALARQAHDPISRAAALEAHGVVAALEDGLAALEGAEQGWRGLGRRVDVARCLALRGDRLAGHDAAQARTLARAAAVAYEELGLGHLAARSWDLAAR